MLWASAYTFASRSLRDVHMCYIQLVYESACCLAWGLFSTEGKIVVLSVSSLFLTRVGVYVCVSVCIEGMCQCFHQCWNDDGLSYNSVIKRSNKAKFGLHLAETTKVFSRQLCNNYKINKPISMKISAAQSSPQDTCFHHK